ncbi:Histidinol-phosphate aminotransferase [Eubacterium plexicaudatum ASF492]|uniref:Histidinol-phosphate aminotransferase n=1 Tax=Eubacterium plexicaudatum ASF492 TaxID=1235802 RepID=N2AGS5_9FIRM|nr:Histidinol-phosphate aminotransferase [Eubacterium plexicaudatum ASF492]
MKLWEANIRKVVPYVPGEQPGEQRVIKLNTNENPYPPAPGVVESMYAFDTDRLRLYPDPEAGILVRALAKRYRVKPEQVFVGVGSDDVLAMAFLTFFNSDKPILFPDITYSFYDVWAELFRIPYRTVPLDERFRICAGDYDIPNGGVVFANPNAPTGELESLTDIEHILRHNEDVIVIVDEAYIDFGGTSALQLLGRYENLLVVQTFSKSRSLAGMRIGYAFGSQTLIQYLNDVKYSFNSYTMNQVTLTAGAAALEEESYFKKTIHKIIATRERVKEEFQKLGFVFGDSRSNFLFVTHPNIHAKELFEALKKEHIYVRYFAKPRIDNYLRITIGTDEEMDVLLDFLRVYLKNSDEK